MDFEDYLKESKIYGRVVESRYPIVYIEGLPGVKPDEMIVFENNEFGQILDIEEGVVHALTFSNNPIDVKTQVTKTGGQTNIVVGQNILGKIISPLGKDLETGEKFRGEKIQFIFEEAPEISERVKIDEPFETGVAKVDLLIPLGKGQREIILGDVKTGKTSLAQSAMKMHGQQKDTIIVYAAIGKRKSEINRISEFIKKNNIEKSSVVVATSASDNPGAIYITPYTAMAVAEYFKGLNKDVLVIMDDLTTHSQNYREISLLSNRFPGRESYPGDIFYAHASLLERAGRFKNESGKPSSITCLPIATTVEGDITGYISTNLMGMTDGHILFDTEIYNLGKRPAINIPLSVTRVGRQTQTKLERQITVKILSLMAKYEKVKSIAHLGSELSEESKSIIKKGETVDKILEQKENIVKKNIQIILVGLAWLNQIDIESDSQKEDLQKKLSEYYTNPQGKKVIDDLMALDDFATFLAHLSGQAELIQLCKKNNN